MADMPNKRNNKTKGPSLTRREVLVGAAGLTVAAAAVKVGAAPQQFALGSASESTDTVLRRYMAAAATIGDGRVLVTGGYSRPWKAGSSLHALDSAVLVDPSSGKTTTVAPMNVPRARHAAVMLVDGRVVVIGGMGMNPTASIELFDPSTNRWTTVGQLAQPRYDHAAVYDGSSIHIIGGSGMNMISGIETIYPGGDTWS